MVYLPGGTEQKPHRHNSVALDLIIDAPESAYTLVGKSLDEYGNIVNGERVYWKSGSVFVTPLDFGTPIITIAIKMLLFFPYKMQVFSPICVPSISVGVKIVDQ